MAGMRWSSAVAVVSAGIEAHIEQCVYKASRGRELLYLLKGIDPPTRTTASAPARTRPVGKRPAAGTIPGRVLDIVGEHDRPMSMRQILAAKHGAKPYHIASAVRQLVKSGWLVATGATSTRCYSLPVKKSGRVSK